MPPVIVVGSGPAAVAATRRLVALGRRPLVLDAGRRLSPARSAAVRRMASGDPVNWNPADLALVSANPTISDPVPRRLAFGSAYPYAETDPALHMTVDPCRSPVPSLAHGGMSNVWGAAVLPIAAADMVEWPIRHQELTPAYRDVLRGLPLVGARDDLQREFPLHRDEVGALPAPPLAAGLIDRLQGRDGLLVGRARLAVDATPTSTDACRGCGRCDIGCVYGSIWNSGRTLDHLVAQGLVDHLPGVVVRSVDEVAGTVRIHATDLDGGRPREIEGERVFLAAGAIQSTRIMMESLEVLDRPVHLSATRGFGMAMLHLGRGLPADDAPTLAAVFLELQEPDTGRWIHVQASPLNRLVRAKLASAVPVRGLGNLLGTLAARQSLLAVCSLPPSSSSGQVMRLVPGVRSAARLRIDAASDRSQGPEVAPVVRRVRSIVGSAGFVPIGPILGLVDGRPPVSWHLGGSMPMGVDVPSGLGTDRLGRVAALRRVHVVDSSVFTTLPATTVTLPAMANATRIVNEAMAPVGAGGSQSGG